MQNRSRGAIRALLVIASEAKQSSLLPAALDCFVASLLAMTKTSVLAARSAPESCSPLQRSEDSILLLVDSPPAIKEGSGAPKGALFSQCPRRARRAPCSPV